jgi:hypothetical protein
LCKKRSEGEGEEEGEEGEEGGEGEEGKDRILFVKIALF